MSRLKAAPPPGPACKDTAPNAGVAPTGPVGAVRSHHCPSGHPFPLLSEAGRASPTHPLSKHNEGPTCASTVLGKVYRGAERRYGLCPQEADNLLRKAAIAKRAHIHVTYYLRPHLRHQCRYLCSVCVSSAPTPTSTSSILLPTPPLSAYRSVPLHTYTQSIPSLVPVITRSVTHAITNDCEDTEGNRRGVVHKE